MFNKKFRFFHQSESVDCGPACLSMICSHFGLKADVKTVKSICSVTRMGVSVQDIVEGGKKIGFETNAYKVNLEEIEQVPLPAILFWKQDHFVVLYKVEVRRNKRIYHIADPGYGETGLEEDVFKNEWVGNESKGVAILFQEGDEGLEIPKIEGRQQDRSLLNNVFSYVKNNKFKYLLSILILFIGLVSNWLSPVIFKRILDEGILDRSLNIVVYLLIAQLILFISSIISEFISEWSLTKINFYLSINLKENFLKKLMKLPISYFDTRLNSDTLERLGDHEKIKNFVTWKGLSLLITSANIIVFSILLFYSSKTVFSIYILLSIFSILWVAVFLKKRAVIEYSIFLRQSANSNLLYEFVMNMPEIRTHNAQDAIIKNIIDLQHKLNRLELRSLFLNIYQLIGVGFLSKLKEIAAIAICAYLIIEGKMTIGSMLATTYILGQLSGPIQNIINFIKDTQDAKIAYNRISDVYNEQNEDDGANLVPLNSDFDIRLKGISFKYPGSFNPFVLENIDFVIPANKTTAIVGQSGSGKTTLLKLLLKYHKVSSGQILLGDQDINQINPDLWRNSCGVVSQEGIIFSGTIAFNIAFSNNIDDLEQIRKVAEIACIDDFISSLPMGYSTKVGSVGIQLSGGQTQRILIARAIYRNPEFIFFDEATSSLDAHNELQIHNNLKTFFKGKTVCIIAHRLSTVKNADQIVVLDQGKVAEIGNHESLVKFQGLYYNLVKNQLELGN
ncbi:peptidase domain-containing ABC transporter [Fluviicola sp.]|jgi:ATP-binding cassette subfamily B protein|uniref:peptidase domain-containing ABC transporter n=1 Tax=Fluviicola sp. TaxID=1917219 RepID=UPI002827C5F4|nr:peptidase domain-containing ABC transporter [Fluviicola sp.]MDR0802297.1 peptidase domain-containing ABC transporter [Fluviicola sp.]